MWDKIVAALKAVDGAVDTALNKLDTWDAQVAQKISGDKDATLDKLMDKGFVQVGCAAKKGATKVKEACKGLRKEKN